ncbi:hypothetical protein OG241_34290 [Streptomyces sp. NBC_01390]|uniref:hypothetical protein n=1 Tax=Streptomyces sp. NBC_01390 TaxID=2903850 RepID=UPI00324ACA97
MTHTPEPAWAPELPFRSPRCALSQHPDCRDSEPRDTGVPGVHYLVCTCTCHHPNPLPTPAPETATETCA